MDVPWFETLTRWIAHHTNRRRMTIMLAGGLVGMLKAHNLAETDAKNKKKKKRRKDTSTPTSRVDACYVTVGDVCDDYTGEVNAFCIDLMNTCCPRAAESFDAVCLCIDGKPC